MLTRRISIFKESASSYVFPENAEGRKFLARKGGTRDMFSLKPFPSALPRVVVRQKQIRTENTGIDMAYGDKKEEES